MIDETEQSIKYKHTYTWCNIIIYRLILNHCDHIYHISSDIHDRALVQLLFVLQLSPLKPPRLRLALFSTLFAARALALKLAWKLALKLALKIVLKLGHRCCEFFKQPIFAFAVADSFLAALL